MARVLLTRPKAQQAGTKRKLEEAGHEVMSEPLLLLKVLQTPSPPGPFGGILLTSANAAPACARAVAEADRETIPVLATGEATANAAKAQGFTNIRHVDGNALDLADAVNKGRVIFPNEGPLLVPRAETVARDLTQLVNRKTLAWTVYRMVPPASFTDDTKQAFADQRIDAVLLTSPLIAATFVDLFDDLPEGTTIPAFIAMSDEISDVLPTHLAKAARVSAHPNEKSLLDLLATHTS